MNNWENELTSSMMPNETFQDIAEQIGVENVLRLSKIVGGATIYIPCYETLLRPVRDKKILEDYNGHNSMELMGKYGVSERWVRILAYNDAMQKSKNQEEKL